MFISQKVLNKHYGHNTCLMKAVSVYFNHEYQESHAEWVITQRKTNNVVGGHVRFCYYLLSIYLYLIIYHNKVISNYFDLQS